MDLDLSISWCERVSEWTFKAHWLSETSPWKTREFWPWTAMAIMNIPAAHNIIARIINQSPDRSRKHGELHVHAFVVFAANYRTHDFIFARFGRSGEDKFLLAGFEQQIPSFDMGSILGSEQGKTVDR